MSSSREGSASEALQVHVFGVEGDKFTGAGQVQRALDEHLARVLPDDWDLTIENGPLGVRDRLLTRVSADATVWICTPLPLRQPSKRHAHFVFDLRWRRTRSGLARVYRRLDLYRIAHRSDLIFAISEHMAEEIRKASDGSVRVVVVPMGPGQVEGRPLREPEDNNTLLLIGRARHKRNEHVARLLAASDLVRSDYRIIAVSVSDETRQVLRSSPVDVEFLDDPGVDEFAQLLERSSTYIGLSVDEGFGLPFAEAAYCGCDVIAVDLPVARETLGPAGNFVPTGALTVAQLEAALQRWDYDRVVQLHNRARQRSWAHFAATIAEWVVIDPNDDR